MKPLFIGLFALVCVSANAQSYHSVKCQVANPCQFRNSGLGYCVGSIDLRFNDGAVNRHHMQVAKLNENGSEVLNIVADIPVSVMNSQRVFGIDESGENWFDLNVSNRVGSGTLALEQDFGFKVVCK